MKKNDNFELAIMILPLAFAALYVSTLVYIGVNVLGLLLIMLVFGWEFPLSLMMIFAGALIMIMLYAGYSIFRSAQDKYLKRHYGNPLLPMAHWAIIAIPMIYFVLSDSPLGGWIEGIFAAMLGVAFNFVYNRRQNNS